MKIGNSHGNDQKYDNYLQKKYHSLNFDLFIMWLYYLLYDLLSKSSS